MMSGMHKKRRNETSNVRFRPALYCDFAEKIHTVMRTWRRARYAAILCPVKMRRENIFFLAPVDTKAGGR